MATLLSDSLQLYEVCLSLIQAYTKSNVGNYSRQSLEEEEQCEYLLLFMKMMTHLTIKDCLDLGDSGELALWSWCRWLVHVPSCGDLET